MATRLPRGGVVVGDSVARDLRLFDTNGRLQRVFGRPGNGPGELGSILTLSQCNPGVISVYDFGHRKLVRYDSGGTVTGADVVLGGSVRLHCAPGGAFLAVQAVLNAFLPTARNAGKMYLFPVDLIVSGDTTRLFDSLPGYDPRPGGRMFCTALTDHFAYVGLTDSAWIAQFDRAGHRRRSFRVSNDPMPMTQQQYEEAVDRFLDAYPAGEFDMLKPRLLALPLPEHGPAWHACLRGPDDQIWIQLTDPKRSPTRIHAFDSTGTLIGDLTLPFPLTIFEIGNDYILGRREDEIGEQRVVVYRTGRTDKTGRTGR